MSSQVLNTYEVTTLFPIHAEEKILRYVTKNKRDVKLQITGSKSVLSN